MNRKIEDNSSDKSHKSFKHSDEGSRKSNQIIKVNNKDKKGVPIKEI